MIWTRATAVPPSRSDDPGPLPRSPSKVHHLASGLGFVSTPHPDGCKSAVDSITFAVPIPVN